ncbi:MAG: hypothetical protein AAF636_03980 [Pseudomonadota bacterium]
MRYTSLKKFIAVNALAHGDTPVAIVLVEDGVEVASTLRHHVHAGFAPVLSLMPASFELPPDLATRVTRIDHDPTLPGAAVAAVNALIDTAPGRWMYYCYNAEYLFFPFCETRRIGEMLTFHTQERRDAMLGYVIDLYADDLGSYPNAVSLDTAHLDRSGYYALARNDPANGNVPRERQLDFFGGLRWRFEEHVPPSRRRIDRIPIFRAKPGLLLTEDHRFSDEEYNTYACPWHHNLTAAICSFRTAKALKRNAGSTHNIDSFIWRNSAPFEWHSQQLLDLGLIEPGQWF